MRSELIERSATKNISDQQLMSVRLLEGLWPVGGRELEDATPRPVGQEAEKVPQVAPRLEVVQLAAGEQRDKGGVYLARVVVSHKEPVPSRDDLPAKCQFRSIVVNGQTRVFEKALQRDALIARVADASPVSTPQAGSIHVFGGKPGIPDS
jgi:hypothetical protein